MIETTSQQLWLIRDQMTSLVIVKQQNRFVENCWVKDTYKSSNRYMDFSPYINKK